MRPPAHCARIRTTYASRKTSNGYNDAPVGPQESVWPGGPRAAAPGGGAAAEGDERTGQPPLELRLPDGHAAGRQVPVGGGAAGQLRCTLPWNPDHRLLLRHRNRAQAARRRPGELLQHLQHAPCGRDAGAEEKGSLPIGGQVCQVRANHR